MHNNSSHSHDFETIPDAQAFCGCLHGTEFGELAWKSPGPDGWFFDRASKTLGSIPQDTGVQRTVV